MFVRFRQTRSRLQLSLIETRRFHGKVRHEHVASLGSITSPPSVADRIEFWARLFERLGKLSNRIGPEGQHKIFDAIHARVPMVTAEERQALQLEAARTNAKQWSAMRDHLAATAADKKGFAEKANAEAAAGKVAADTMDLSAKTAQAHAEAIERGETVEGAADKPEDLLAILKEEGITTADLRHYRLIGLIPEEHFDEFCEEAFRMAQKGERRRHRQAVLKILRKYRND
jgi:hypothetical protein